MLQGTGSIAFATSKKLSLLDEWLKQTHTSYFQKKHPKTKDPLSIIRRAIIEPRVSDSDRFQEEKRSNNDEIED